MIERCQLCCHSGDMEITDHAQLLASLTRAYHLLGGLSDKLHRGQGLSAGQRSLLLLLESRGSLTVSEIARDRAVSRQLIQRLAASLADRGLIKAVPNAASRKSPKLAMTDQGLTTLAGIMKRERAVSDLVVKAITEAELEQMQAVLDKLNQVLTQAASR